MHKPTPREIKVARRYAAIMRVRGNRVFHQTGSGADAMNRGWRAHAYARGWVEAVERFGVVNRPLRQSLPA